MKFLTTLTTLILTIFLITGCGDNNADSANAQAQSTGSQAYGEASSNSSALFTAKDLKGNTRTADEWIGKQPVVMNFWGTWCPPCRREIPELVKLYAEYKSKGVEIIGVALERTAGPEQVQQFASQNAMDWVLLMGNQEISKTFKINGVPMLVMYDASGKEINRLVGLHDAASLREAFESVL